MSSQYWGEGGGGARGSRSAWRTRRARERRVTPARGPGIGGHGANARERGMAPRAAPAFLCPHLITRAFLRLHARLHAPFFVRILSIVFVPQSQRPTPARPLVRGGLPPGRREGNGSNDGTRARLSLRALRLFGRNSCRPAGAGGRAPPPPPVLIGHASSHPPY